MRYLSLFLFGLLSLAYVTLGEKASTTSKTTAEPIRFCDLPINSTCYCCDWTVYANNLALRSMGVIIGCGVTWIVLMIALCCCCWETSLNDNLIMGEEGPGAWCHFAIKGLLMVIPLVLFLAGCMFVLIAHYNLNPIFVSSSNEFSMTLTQIQNQKTSLLQKLANQPEGSSFDTDQLNSGINDLSDNINLFIVEEDNVNIGRNVIVWFSCGFSVFTAILGCIYVQFNKGFLFEFFCACAIILIFGSCCTIAVLDVIHNVSIDLCTELHYSNGAVQLWQSLLVQSVETIEVNQVIPQEQAAVSNACDNLAYMCQFSCCRNTCGTCNMANVKTFLNRTINDEGVQRRVSDCPLHCTNTTLKMQTNSTVNYINIYNFWIQIENLMDNLLLPLEDPSLMNKLKGWTCYLDSSVGEIWAGCGLFIGGAIVSTILCMLLRGKVIQAEKD